MVLVVEHSVRFECLVHQVVNQRIAVAIAVKRFPTFGFCLIQWRGLRSGDDILAHLEIWRTAQTSEGVHIVADNQVAIVRYECREVAGESTLLKIHTVVFLIRKSKGIILKVQYGCRVAGTKHRTTALTGEVAFEDIVLYALHDNHHATLYSLLVLKGQVCPLGGVDKLLNWLLEGVEHLLVGTLYLVRIDSNGAFQLLCRCDQCHTAYTYEGNEKTQFIHYCSMDRILPVWVLKYIFGVGLLVSKLFAIGTAIPNCAIGRLALTRISLPNSTTTLAVPGRL